MHKDHGFVRQFQHGSRHVVHGGHLAVLHHLADAVASGGTRLDSGAGLREVAA